MPTQPIPEGSATEEPRSASPMLLDAGQVARLLGVRPSWIYEAVRSNRLRHVKVGRHLRFLHSDVAAFIQENRS